MNGVKNGGLKVNLGKPVKIVKQPEISETVAEVSVERVAFVFGQGVVRIFLGGAPIEVALDTVPKELTTALNDWVATVIKQSLDGK